MASSGALGTSNQYVKYRIDASPGSGNVSGNYTPVTVSVFVYRTNTGYTTYGTGTIWCKINGTTYSKAITSSQKITNSGITLFSTTVNVPHNADGTKTLSITAWLSIPGAGLSSSEQGFSFALSTIPRATTPSLSPATQVMGKSITISLPRASTGFTHTITYKFGSKTGTIATGAGTSAVFNVPESLVTEIPNGASGIGTITVTTYNGSTNIGTKTINFTATAPDTVVPTIQSVAISETVGGVAAQFGTFVQNISRLLVETEATGIQGSTIVSCTVEVCGATYSGQSVTTNPITQSGTVGIKVTVKDSRGRTATYTKNITVTEYVSPTIEKFAVIRAKSSGEEDVEGEYASCDIKFNISPVLSKNAKSYKIQYKRSDLSTWYTIASGNVYEKTDTIISASAVLSSDYAYTVRLTVTDYFQTVTADVDVGTGAPLIDFRYTKKGVAIGKVSELDGFEVGMETYFYKDVFIIKPDGKTMNVVALLELLENGFEMGTWEPTAYNNIQINSYSDCKYVKIGKLVYIQGKINCNAISENGGQNEIAGLPYPAYGQSTLNVNYANLKGTDGVTKYDFHTSQGTDRIICVYWMLNRSWSGDNGLTTTPGVVCLSGVYITLNDLL